MSKHPAIATYETRLMTDPLVPSKPPEVQVFRRAMPYDRQNLRFVSPLDVVKLAQEQRMISQPKWLVVRKNSKTTDLFNLRSGEYLADVPDMTMVSEFATLQVEYE